MEYRKKTCENASLIKKTLFIIAPWISYGSKLIYLFHPVFVSSFSNLVFENYSLFPFGIYFKYYEIFAFKKSNIIITDQFVYLAQCVYLAGRIFAVLAVHLYRSSRGQQLDGEREGGGGKQPSNSPKNCLPFGKNLIP